MSRKKKQTEIAKPNDGKRSVWAEITKGLEAFPLKALSGLATAIGASIIVAYYVHIEYLPSLEAVNIPILFGQVFYAGMLTCIVFMALFATVFLVSSSTETKLDLDEKRRKTSNIYYFLELVLAHFPLIFFIFSREAAKNPESNFIENWGLPISWALAFTLLVVGRHRIIFPASSALNTPSDPNTEINIPEQGNAPDEGRAPENCALPDKASDKPEKSIFYIEESFVFAGVAICSAIPVLILALIFESAPISAHIDMPIFWLFWLLLAVLNSGFSRAPEVKIGQKILVAGAVIFSILSISRIPHLPVVLAARIAGIGHVNHVDFELTNSRCIIVKRQLLAEGIKDRLICLTEETANEKTSVDARAAATMPKEAPSIPANVLKDVLVLNRVGTEFYIEVSAVNGNSIESTKNVNQQKKSMPSSAPPPSNNVSKNATANPEPETEPVVRLRIPRSEANEMVKLNRPISSGGFFGKNKT